jgi:hypothetical protein
MNGGKIKQERRGWEERIFYIYRRIEGVFFH